MLEEYFHFAPLRLLPGLLIDTLPLLTDVQLSLRAKNFLPTFFSCSLVV